MCEKQCFPWNVEPEFYHNLEKIQSLHQNFLVCKCLSCSPSNVNIKTPPKFSQRPCWTSVLCCVTRKQYIFHYLPTFIGKISGHCQGTCGWIFSTGFSFTFNLSCLKGYAFRVKHANIILNYTNFSYSF